MFDLPILQTSLKVRSGPGQWAAEAVATFGLVLIILMGAPRKSPSLPAVVACYITAACWFTASTSFANPAVTVARAVSNSFTGIAPSSVPAFLVAQAIGAVLALGVARLLLQSAK
jgi:glycerol uptake facilitator-like aquaporin